MSNIILGIDASRNRSGGAKSHIIGFLENCEPDLNEFKEVHIWSYKELLNKLPNKPWLFKHSSSWLEKNILLQLFWQFYIFPTSLKKHSCSICLNTDAGTISKFVPSVTMSRDMLSYEKGEMNRFGLSKQTLRLYILKFVQNKSLKISSGTIFLTDYASNVIQKFTGPIKNFVIIPHGISDKFRNLKKKNEWPDLKKNKILRCIYVSNTSEYKHQDKVVSAICNLRKNGYPISLQLVGGGSGKIQVKLNQLIKKNDPKNLFLFQSGYVEHNDIPKYLSNADLFIFASSCENMPNTLLEGMASGISIVSSNKGPMPEVLKDGGIYFDPEKINSIEESIIKINDNKELREKMIKRSIEIASQYSWNRCASETLRFIKNTYKQIS